MLALVLIASEPSVQPPSAPARVEMAFRNGEIPLAGTLLVPEGDGPFPCAVIVHGSGDSDRSNPWTSAHADALVRRGIAVVHPDKRGAGASGGSWRVATFADLAGDALAAVEFARSQERIDGARVGLIGFSQGGHVAPLAAARSPRVAFVINVSGSVVPMMEQIGDELRLRARREGLDAAQTEALQALHQLAVRHAVSGDPAWDAYRDGLRAASEGALRGTRVVEGFPREEDSPAWTVLRAMGDLDPLPSWRALTVPALFLYGGRDESVDVRKSVGRIESELMASGLAYSVLLFRNNGHALYREDALDFIARWIHDRGAD